MKKNKSILSKYAVPIYFLATILITWGGILMVAGWDGITGAAEIPETQMPILYAATLLGPSVAGLIMTGLAEGKKGYRSLFSRFGKVRIGFKQYALALLTAPFLITGILLALSIKSKNFTPAVFSAGNDPSLIAIGLVMGLAVGLFEELGWTGFAVPRLLKRYSTLKTGLITGIVWGLWHAPLFIGSMKMSGNVPPVIYLTAMLFSFLPVYRVLMVWLYERTESLLAVVLMHAPLSASQLILIPANLAGKQLVMYNLIFTALLWLIFFLIESSKKKVQNY